MFGGLWTPSGVENTQLILKMDMLSYESRANLVVKNFMVRSLNFQN